METTSLIDPIPSANESAALPRPEPSPALIAQVTKWWRETTTQPEFDRAVVFRNECTKALFPSWFDPVDKFKGGLPFEQRRRKDDRQVRLNTVYRNVMQTVAMCVPDDHEVAFTPPPAVGQETGDFTDPAAGALASTLKVVVDAMRKESDLQGAYEDMVQDACTFRIACMKIVYDRDFVGGATSVTNGDDKDTQRNRQLYNMLVSDFHRGVFTRDDAQFLTMTQLQEALGEESEVRVWHGLRVENIPIDSIRFDPTIRDYRKIYQAKWMRHDTLMSVEDIRTKYPFEMQEDGSWTGIHPDDLKAACNTQPRDGLSDTYWNRGRQFGKGPSNVPDSKQEADRLLVSEVWIRAENRVLVLVENMNYPAASYVPERTPSQWYPFRFLRLNRVPNHVYGVSDVELQMEIQHRINRKRSDDEKARNLAIARGFYNKQGVDQAEMEKLKDHPPGELKGLNLPAAEKIGDVIMWVAHPYDPQHFDTEKDEQDMRSMAALPEQALGVTGRANSATEVNAAMQGASISANHRMNHLRAWMTDTYQMIIEVLLQELTLEDVQEIAGVNAFWPKVYSEMDAARMVMTIQRTTQDVAMTAAASGLPVDPMLAEGQKQQLMIQAFGSPEPLTREALFRRMRVAVNTAMNAQADQNKRINSVATVFSAIQSGAQAAAAAGMRFDPAPLLKMFGAVVGADLTKMFTPMPMMPGMPMAPGAMPPVPSAPGNQPGVAVAGSGADEQASPVGPTNPNSGNAEPTPTPESP